MSDSTASAEPEPVSTIASAAESPAGGAVAASARTPTFSGAILRPMLRTALLIGPVLATAEVAWAYLLPSMVEDWRCDLPASAGGLALFLLAAVATDVIVMLVAGLMLAVAIALIRLVIPPVRRFDGWAFVIRWLMWTGAVSFVYVGWMALYILMPDERGEFYYRAALALGVLAALLGSLIACAVLAWSQRRVHRRAPALCWGLGIAALLVIAARGFGGYASAVNGSTPSSLSSSAARGPDVLLVTIDTLRADYVGCYGHPFVQTPTLDALAADGVLFEAAISQAPTTGPSHCSLFTSAYPGAHEGWNGKPMKRGLITLADLMRAHGRETIAFTSATTTCSMNTGLQQGFDRFVDSLVSWSTLASRDEFQQLLAFYLMGFARDSQVRGDVVTHRALDWLSSGPRRPFFAWLHYFDPHAPYDPPRPFEDRYAGRIDDGGPMARERERYAAEVAFVDFQLGRVIDELKHRNLYDETLIVFTSDHGEAFGEKHAAGEERGHGGSLYDTTQHVPLIIKPPKQRLAEWSAVRAAEDAPLVPQRVAEQVELIDLAPTILELADIEPPASFVGKSLVDLLADRPFAHKDKPAFCENVITVRDPKLTGNKEVVVRQLAMRTRDWKCIYYPRVNAGELYDLVRDPKETRTVARQYERIVNLMHRAIIKALGEEPAEVKDPRRRAAPVFRERLKALGYLGDD